MTRRMRHIVVLLLLLAVAAVPLAALPVTFVRNAGQWDQRARFRLDHGGMRLWFADGGILYDLDGADGAGHRLRLRFDGGRWGDICGVDPEKGRWNFLADGGRRPRSIVAEGFRGIACDEILPGVDLHYYSHEGAVKYDLLVAPGADPSAIWFRYDGADRVRVREDSLVIATSVGELREAPPVAWQDIDGRRRYVDCRFRLDGDRVGFVLGDHDRSRPLVIDPLLLFSSYLGGSGVDQGRGVDRDATGNIYVVGTTRSNDFPTTVGAYRRTPISFNGSSDIFVARLNQTATILLSATYIGGTGADEAAAIRVARNGRMYVAGTTSSNDFPVTPGAFATSPAGGNDGFILALNPDGSAIAFASYLGGSGNDQISDLALGNNDNPYVSGWTSSANMPVPIGSYSAPVRGGEDAFVSRFSSALDTLRFTAILGGSIDDRASSVVVEPGGGAWVTGWTRSNNFPSTDSAFSSGIAGGVDCFIARVRFNGAALDYSTMIGGSGDDEGTAVAVDSTGNAYATGRTVSTDYPIAPIGLPTTPGSWFITKVAWPPTPRLLYSRYLGVVDNGSARTLQVDRAANAFIGGVTNSPLFPRTPDADTSSRRGGMDLAFVRLDATGGVIVHSVVIGGSRGDTLGHGSHLGTRGDLVVTGTTASSDFPLERGAFDSSLNSSGLGPATDAFILQYGFDPRPVLFTGSRRSFDSLACDSTALDSFYVYNVGERNLVINDNIFRLGNSPYVLLQPRPVDLPRTIRPGDSLLYVVRVTLLTTGTARDTLVITSNDSLLGKQRFPIALTTVRTIPAVAAVPKSISFGNVVVCPPSGVDTILRVTNSGQGKVTVDGVSFARNEGSFILAPPVALPKVLQEREVLPISVRFRPLRRGLHRDTMIVRISECTTPLRIPVEGVGDSVALRFVEGELRIGPLPWCAVAFDTVVTVSNDGDRSVSITDGRVLGSGFVLLDTLPITLAPGERVPLRLRVVPPPAGGVAVASLQIGAVPCGISLALALGVERRAKDSLATSSGATLDFGSLLGCTGEDAAVDTVLVLHNPGSGTIVLNGALISSPFAFRTPPGFPVSIPPGDSLALPLRYLPPQRSNDQGELLVLYESQGCPDTLRIALRGSREDVLVEGSADTVDLPDVVQCRSNADTTIVLFNRTGVPVAIDSASIEADAILLRRLPFVLPANGSDTVTLRLVPSQAGAASGSVTFYTRPCRLPIRFDLRGRKEGVVLAFDPSGILRFPTVLSCALPDTAEATLTLRNSGNHPVPAEVISYRVVGNDPSFFIVDPSVVGLVVPSGESRTMRIRFVASSIGLRSGTLELVTAPCGDTLRLDLEGSVEPPLVDITGGSFGSVNLNNRKTAIVTVVNRNSTGWVVDSLANLVPPFRLVASIPSLPVRLEPGDTLRLEIEFAPTVASPYSLTPSIAINSPCPLQLPFTLEGIGVAVGGDTARLCLDGVATGLVGDTIELEVRLLSPPQPLSQPSDLLFDLAYSWRRLQFLEGTIDGAVLLREPGSPQGGLRLRRSGADELGPGTLRLRFRLLAGRENPARVRLDSVRIGDGSPPVEVCDDSVRVEVLDRCIVTGLGFGRYRNALSPPHPNPARQSVEVAWSQLEDARTRLLVVDVAGREVLRPLDADLPGGSYSVRFSIEDLPSGIYLYIIEAGGYREAQRLVVVE